jgi:cell wall-associated NlpC family hydrolase
MHFKRLIALTFILSASSLTATAFAQPTVAVKQAAMPATALMTGLSIFAPATALAQSTIPGATVHSFANTDKNEDKTADDSVADVSDADIDLVAHDGNSTDPREMLMALAMKLRDIRYRRGGTEPSTGFDCSGFVRYVFRHSIGLDLPPNSAKQFLAGLNVKRTDMKPGDLVFFRTRGNNISHVGIYIDNGQFIHSPSAGKVVRVDNLNESYWAKRFVGAKRPDGIARI